MEHLLAIAGFVTVAVITPGPNNFIVLGAAARGGLAAAAAPIAGVIAGTLGLLALVWAGAGLVFDAVPFLRLVISVASALFLVTLGAILMWRANGRGDADDQAGRDGMPGTALGLAGFQFLNPKSWVLVLTATAASSGDLAGLAALAALFIALPAVCLTLWATAGSALSNWLTRPQPRRWFNRAMGVLLMASAALLLA